MQRADTRTGAWRSTRNRKDTCPVRAFNLSPQIFDRASTQVSGGSPNIRGQPADADFGKARGGIGLDHEDNFAGPQIVRTASDFGLGLTRRQTFFRVLLRDIGGVVPRAVRPLVWRQASWPIAIAWKLTGLSNYGTKGGCGRIDWVTAAVLDSPPRTLASGALMVLACPATKPPKTSKVNR